ncbi:MAG: glycosyltransferase family 2 protein [Gemmataceae bacterium]|nr:glycosyltransferase family 2 protein [Gemmataceae bacterium]MCI0741004.1 glycosyltransferase family 2 protein [Gemmataceae bacterium]
MHERIDSPKPLLSIVCPVYEEQEVLPHFHRELSAALEEVVGDHRVEILYVDDGSRDRTLVTLRQLAAGDARVRYVALSRNFGHQAALCAGLDRAEGDVVISMDADLQHPPRVIPTLLERWQHGYDVVQTIRADDERVSFLKRLSSRWFYKALRYVSDADLRAASDFRLLSRAALDALLRMREKHLFLRGQVQWLGFPTAQVHFHSDPRRAGRSKYTMRKMLRLAGDGLFSFSLAPLRAASFLGIAALCAGVGHAVWALLGPGFTAWMYVAILMCFLGGAILCALGILGEYVGRIFEEVKQRPLYVVKEDSCDRNKWKRRAARRPNKDCRSVTDSGASDSSLE